MIENQITRIYPARMMHQSIINPSSFPPQPSLFLSIYDRNSTTHPSVCFSLSLSLSLSIPALGALCFPFPR